VAAPVTFDFDSGLPLLQVYATLPVDQTSGGVTAHFQPGEASVFSVQDTASLFSGLVLSPFSGKFLVPGDANTNGVGGLLEIRFSQLVSSIEFPFATIQVPPIETETPITLDAYSGSLSLPPVGVTNVAGIYGGLGGHDTWPTGLLRFRSPTPFNRVRIYIPTLQAPPPGGQATDFLIDSVTVDPAGGATCSIAGAPSPAGGGEIIGEGGYSVGVDATLLAQPHLGYVFKGWYENGNLIATNNPYSFVAREDRVLTALLAPVSYLLKVGSSPAAGGSVTPSGVMSVPAGSRVKLNASPAPGFLLVGWRQGAGLLSATNRVGSAPTLQFTPDANLTVIAEFARGASLTLSANPPEGGELDGGGLYLPGAPVTVSARPSPGFRFAGWSDATGTLTAASDTFTWSLSGAASLVGRFAPMLTLSQEASQGLSVTWPRATPDYVLLEAATPDAPQWVPVQASPSLVGGARQVIVFPDGGARYFRLGNGTP